MRSLKAKLSVKYTAEYKQNKRMSPVCAVLTILGFFTAVFIPLYILHDNDYHYGFWEYTFLTVVELVMIVFGMRMNKKWEVTSRSLLDYVTNEEMFKEANAIFAFNKTAIQTAMRNLLHCEQPLIDSLYKGMGMRAYGFSSAVAESIKDDNALCINYTMFPKSMAEQYENVISFSFELCSLPLCGLQSHMMDMIRVTIIYDRQGIYDTDNAHCSNYHKVLTATLFPEKDEN